jgi:hypothetical protein
MVRERVLSQDEDADRAANESSDGSPADGLEQHAGAEMEWREGHD